MRTIARWTIACRRTSSHRSREQRRDGDQRCDGAAERECVDQSGYDRPNTRTEGRDASTSRAQPHAVDEDVDDLHRVLEKVGAPEPYVLVAHSYDDWLVGQDLLAPGLDANHVTETNSGHNI
jgi:hypothetical protein